MRIRLPESERTRTRRPGAAVASAALHGVLIALAVNATVEEPRAEPAPPAPPLLVYHAPPPAPVMRQATTADGASGPSAPARPTIPMPAVPTPAIPLPGPIVLDVPLPGTSLGPPIFDRRPIGAPGGPPGPTTGSGSDGPRDAWSVERAAAPLREVRPRYPDALRARGAEGSVLARYVVDSTGRVVRESVTIVEATAAPFGDAVRHALLGARFRPAEAGGRAVAQLVEQRFLFTLRDR